MEKYLSRSNKLTVLHRNWGTAPVTSPRCGSGLENGAKGLQPPSPNRVGEAGWGKEGAGRDGGGDGSRQGEEEEMKEGNDNEFEVKTGGAGAQPPERLGIREALVRDEKEMGGELLPFLGKNGCRKGSKAAVGMAENEAGKVGAVGSGGDRGWKAKKSRVQGPEEGGGEPFDLKNGDIVVVSDANDGLPPVANLGEARRKAAKSPLGAHLRGFSLQTEGGAPLLLEGPPRKSWRGTRLEVGMKISMVDYED